MNLFIFYVVGVLLTSIYCIYRGVDSETTAVFAMFWFVVIPIRAANIIMKTDQSN
jgi:hypothetical protein